MPLTIDYKSIHVSEDWEIDMSDFCISYTSFESDGNARVYSWLDISYQEVNKGVSHGISNEIFELCSVKAPSIAFCIVYQCFG